MPRIFTPNNINLNRSYKYKMIILFPYSNSRRLIFKTNLQSTKLYNRNRYLSHLSSRFRTTTYYSGVSTMDNHCINVFVTDNHRNIKVNVYKCLCYRQPLNLSYLRQLHLNYRQPLHKRLYYRHSLNLSYLRQLLSIQLLLRLLLRRLITIV